MEHSKKRQFFYIPREILKEIQSLERQALLFNALYLGTLAYECISNVGVIKRLHERNPLTELPEIYRPTIFGSFLETLIFIVLFAHFFIWRPANKRYGEYIQKNVIQGKPSQNQKFEHIRMHSHELSFDGHLIKNFLQAILVYIFLEEGIYHLLPNGWYLTYLYAIHISIASVIFVGGLRYIYRKQQEHLLELENDLEYAEDPAEEESVVRTF